MPKLGFVPLRVRKGSSISDAVMESLPAPPKPRRKKRMRESEAALAPEASQAAPAQPPEPVQQSEQVVPGTVSALTEAPVAQDFPPSAPSEAAVPSMEPSVQSKTVPQVTVRVGNVDLDLDNPVPGFRESLFNALTAFIALKFGKYPMFVDLYRKCVRKLAESGDPAIAQSEEVSGLKTDLARVDAIPPEQYTSSRDVFAELAGRLETALGLLQAKTTSLKPEMQVNSI